jgi:uncharacterized protein (TIGR02145 family)
MSYYRYCIYLVMVFIFSCKSSLDTEIFITDDGYRAVRLGNQIWMVDNLEKEVFNNGDSIQEVVEDAVWVRHGSDKIPAMCWYDNSRGSTPANGRLYNRFAVNDSRGLAPIGWRIPTEADWDELAKYLGSQREAGNALKDTAFWEDASGRTMFSALPGGGRDAEGQYRDGEVLAAWWTSGKGNGRAIGPRPGLRSWWWFRNNVNPANGFHVRCIKS